MHQFQAEVRHRDGVAVIDLLGDVNAEAEQALDAATREAEAYNPNTILLNFTNVGYINSTGIALIVGILARARRERRSVAACGLSEHYQEIFTITRLSDFMRMFPDEESALAEQPAV
ncbi:MAG: anti-sigma factor antagonist [Chloroflexi bacterium]|nr:MAG: anti-sigma factor antagonist [Chloroflexota bacterium]